MLKVIARHSPKEVYIALSILYFLLFLNSAELLRSQIDILDIFEIRRSIIFGLIRGLGDDHLKQDAAFILYWIILVFSSSILLVKARKISRWLWDS
jgi:hypothetical protein